MLSACTGFSFHLMALLAKGEEGQRIPNTQAGRFTQATRKNHLGYIRDLPNQQQTWGFHGSLRRSHSPTVSENSVFLA